MGKLEALVEQMHPQDAMAEIAGIMKKLFQQTDEQGKLDFVMKIMGDEGADKVASMVNLWLAECMDEGVDPTRMCQSLVEKVAQSKQLQAVADPEILVLFESWLEELEEEVILHLKNYPAAGVEELASSMGFSKSGASFLVAKLRREEKI